MSRIVVIGGTGHAGGNVAVEAASRGHEVVSVARHAPEHERTGVTEHEGSVLDLDALAPILEGADVVLWAVSPRGDMAEAAIPAFRALVERLRGTTTRLGAVGGAMGSLSEPGGPRLWDLGVPEALRHEGGVGVETLEILQQAPADLDWFLVHPPKEFGAWVPGERTGAYRDGGDVVVVADDGTSFISGADFAIAVVDEIENRRHERERFTVGY